jgi:hypothetical protein
VSAPVDVAAIARRALELIAAGRSYEASAYALIELCCEVERERKIAAAWRARYKARVTLERHLLPRDERDAAEAALDAAEADLRALGVDQEAP